ncbi:MAG TPA: sugar phosphate isomerase/epimerase family protein [Anaerolineae bacterium]
MKLAQSSFLYFNFPLKQAIRRLHQLGYQGIEIWGGRPHMYRHDLDAELDSLKALLDECEMTVPNFIPAQFRYPSILCSSNTAVRRDSVRYIEDAIDNALGLGAPSVSLCAGMTLAGESVDAGWANLRQSITELLDYTDKTKLLLLIEPAHRAESTLILTAADGLRMVHEIKSERLGICFDTGHAAVNGEDLAQSVRLLAGVPMHIHIDDNRGDSDAHMIPGEGSVDFASFADALEEIGYRGFVSAELGFQYTLDPDTAARETRSALSELFEPKGEPR